MASRRADAEAGRHPQRDADGGSAGILDPRVVHHLRSVAGGALLLESRDLRSAQAGRERGDRHRRAGRALVVAGQLPQPRPLPPQEREVARREAVLLGRRQVHLRRRARGQGRAGQAPLEPAERLVRQRRGHRGARRPHGDLPAQAAPALVDPDARVWVFARVSRPRAAGRATPALRGDGTVQAEGVHPGADGRARAQSRVLREGSPVSRRHPLSDHHRARDAAGRAADRPARHRHPARDDEAHGRDDQEERALAEPGPGPAKPLRLELTTRAIAIYVDLASFVADQLRQVGVEAAVKQLDTAQYFPALARREFVIGANLTAGAFDDPDAYLFENYKCGTARNYTDYCNEAMDRLIDKQSEELDRDKRLKRVWEIQRKLEADVARPMLGWRTEYFTRWPYVKNLVPHNSLYNYARMQEVWLDR